jgi:glutathione S-transferase
MINLYGNHTSPFVRHCRIRLAEYQIEHQFVEVDLAEFTTTSPTMRIPYLEDGMVKLSDSSSILAYIAEKANEPYLADFQEVELYSAANTLQDTSINLFLLAKENINPDNSNYMARQKARLEATLASLDSAEYNFSSPLNSLPLNNGALRLACYLDWAIFREQLSNITRYPNLKKLLDHANKWELFSQTSPHS